MLNLKPKTHSVRTAVHHSWKPLKRKANKWEVRKIKEEWCDGWSWYDVWCWYENGIKVFPLKIRWRRAQRGWHYKGYKPDTLISLPEENAPSLDLQRSSDICLSRWKIGIISPGCFLSAVTNCCYNQTKLSRQFISGVLPSQASLWLVFTLILEFIT